MSIITLFNTVSLWNENNTIYSLGQGLLQCHGLCEILGRLRRVDLIISIWGSECPSVRLSVRPSAKSFSDSDEIWYVGRGQWVMHDSMPYDPIQGQGQAFKVRNSSIFKMYLFRHFKCELANDHWFWNYVTISNFCTEQIFDICPSFCVPWLRTWNGVTLKVERFPILATFRQIQELHLR